MLWLWQSETMADTSRVDLGVTTASGPDRSYSYKNGILCILDWNFYEILLT